MFALYSYIAKVVTEVGGLPDGAVPVFLLAFGLGMVAGTCVAGALADWSVFRSLLGSSLAMAVLLLLYAALAPAGWWALIPAFLVAIASSVLVVNLQLRLMSVAGDAQTLGAAMNHSSLNVGNALGAWLGGLVIAAGWGYRAPALVGRRSRARRARRCCCSRRPARGVPRSPGRPDPSVAGLAADPAGLLVVGDHVEVRGEHVGAGLRRVQHRPLPVLGQASGGTDAGRHRLGAVEDREVVRPADLDRHPRRRGHPEPQLVAVHGEHPRMASQRRGVHHLVELPVRVVPDLAQVGQSAGDQLRLVDRGEVELGSGTATYATASSSSQCRYDAAFSAPSV